MLLQKHLDEMTKRTRVAGAAALSGESRGIRARLPFFGPAIIASVAYMDPGNFATNIQSGAQFGYTLLWVVLLANLVAMLFQALSAKLGLVTGMSLAEACRERFPKPVVYAMWLGSECAAMATDLAEVLGGAVGLSLLFGLPLFVSTVITGIATYVILILEGNGFRPMEVVISTFVGAIGFSYIAELLIARPDWGAAAYHSLVPSLPGSNALLLAAGIVGATVMPHAIYLHSSLMKNRIRPRNADETRRLLRFSNHEVLIALGVAGLVNMAMVAMAAGVFHTTGHADVASIETAYRTLEPLLGIAAAGIFMLSLLASGFSSSIVGTMAGATIMQDFVRFRVPLWLRRTITLVPALIVIAMGVDTTKALVLSQVVLSVILPVPVVALLILTSRRNVMGAFANSRMVTLTASTAAAAILVLNAVLIVQVAGFIG